MNKLAVLDNPRLAQAFIDYMASRHIDIKMMPESEGCFALWLMDSQHVVEAEAELKHFLAEPHNSKYQAASWHVADSRTAKFSYSSPSLMSMFKAQAGPFTLIVMLSCIAVFALQLLGWSQSVFSLFHFPAYAEQKFQVWRFFSHALLHFSAVHIVFNLLWWWQLGGEVEQKLGVGKLAQIFLLSALFSGLGQFWVEGANFGGLSGVVYALVGYIWFSGWLAPERGLVMAKPLIGFMLIWLVIGFAQPFMAIANTAHLVGLLSGCLLALIDVKWLKKTETSQ